MKEGKIRESRHYTRKSNSDIINFPVVLRQHFLSPKKNQNILKAPISALRIIFKTLNDASYDQFQTNDKKHQRRQLSLFEDDFLTANNCYARFTFKVSDISTNKNYRNIEAGLVFLENLHKGWYKSRNSKTGKIVKSLSGFIREANITEGKITFLMSAYWLEQILKIDSFNSALLQTAWELKNTKHLLVYLWLLEVPDSGTKIRFDNFQKIYHYNYGTTKDLAKNVFKSIKNKLDKKSNKSFNYAIRGNLIHIMPYYTKNIELDIRSTTLAKQQITQKLHYWKKRHLLSTNDIAILKSLINIENTTFTLFVKAYRSFIRNCRENRIRATSFTGQKFLEIFQDEIKNGYDNSYWHKIAPKGYPKIIDEN
jgi:hypothetical protein